jgi:hypothetical protein
MSYDTANPYSQGRRADCDTVDREGRIPAPLGLSLTHHRLVVEGVEHTVAFTERIEEHEAPLRCLLDAPDQLSHVHLATSLEPDGTDAIDP